MSQQHEEEEEVELDPKLVEIIEGLSDDRKKLLKDKNFQNAPQLRQWIAQFQTPRLEALAEWTGLAFEDVHGFAASNLVEMRRLRKFMVEGFKKLGYDVPLAEMPSPDEDEEELINAMEESFVGLVNLLSTKIPNDPDIQKALNDLNEAMNDVVDELMPGTGDDDDGPGDKKSGDDSPDGPDDEEEEEEDDDGDEASPEVT